MTEGIAGIDSAGKAETANAAGPEALEPGAHGRAESWHERVSDELRHEESDRAKAPHKLGTAAEGGASQETEQKRTSDDHSPSEARREGQARIWEEGDARSNGAGPSCRLRCCHESVSASRLE